MTEQPSRFGEFVAELKRRHVGRVSLAYLAAAFVALQVAEIILPAFGLGEVALRLLVALAALGFPVAVVLAWVFDITGKGIRRTDGSGAARGGGSLLLPRIALVGLTLTAAGFAAWWIVGATGAESLLVDSDASSVPVAPVGSADVTDMRSLAVLPLETFSEAGGQDWFAAGMHDQIVTRLSQLPSLRVVSRTSTIRYQGTDKSVPQIAAELGVDGIVEGSVLRSDDRVRITVQLIHGPSDTHVWANDYEEELSDVIALQARVARAIAQEIQGELSAEDVDLMTPDRMADGELEVQDAYVRGTTELDRGTAEGYRNAAELFRAALARDSSYAPALAGLASSRLMLAIQSPEVGLDTAQVRSLAERALELDADLPEALSVLTFLRAERLRPGGPPSPGAGGDTGTPGPELERLFRPGLFAHVGTDSAGSDPTRPRLSDAAGAFRTLSGGASGAFPGPTALTDAALQLQGVGRTREALDLVEGVEASRLAPLSPAWDALEYLYAVSGSWDRLVALRQERGTTDPDDAADLREAVRTEGPGAYWEIRAEELDESVDRSGPQGLYFLATALAGAGEADEAFRVLESAVERGDRRLRLIRQDPTWDGYRTDPRYREVIRRVRP